MKKVFFLLSLMLSCSYAFACTSAIISPARSATGEVMVWKNRDNSMHDTWVAYKTGGTYNYVALVSSSGTYGGLNSKGFGFISNTVSNICVGSDVGSNRGDNKYGLAVLGLRECTTVDEFEETIKNYKRVPGYQAMLAVCDAKGNSAWFEISEKSYVRYNATDDKNGFVIRSNFGFSGDDLERGTSVRRYNLMKKQMEAHKENFSVQDFVDYSRSFQHTSQGDILLNDKEYVDASYTVNRYTTCAEIIIVSGAHPRIFFINGNPLAGMAIPVFLGATIPECLKEDGLMYNMSEKYLAKAYTKKANGDMVLNKDIARKVQALKYTVYDPVVKPTNTKAFADQMDFEYEQHAALIQRVLNGEDVTDVKSVKNNNESEEQNVFNLQGMQMTEPQKGLNIVRYKNGKVKKVIK